uniref:Sodium/potassium-transporting ATPase subunit beta n=1 Tax=Meloidogyne incognita TaxID=6306 RepID=A0A914LKB8_MELIC
MTKDEAGKFVEENNTLMANGRTKPSAKTSLSTFIYNRREGTFLGRTGKSWVQIVVFYIFFYIFLAAFWIACLAIFLQTIDNSTPKYYGKDTIIGDNPGVGYQPWLKDQPESTLIKFNPKNSSSYAAYTNTINKYLEKYSKIEKTRKCSGQMSNSEFIKEGKANGKAEACRFELTEFNKAGCGNDTDYGFQKGTPCIILSLNRLIGWQPKDYEKDQIPDQLKDRYAPGHITFYCNGTSEIDDELIGAVEYIPKEGIDGRYYPYAVMDNYQQPFAMVKFKNLPKNRIVMVECGAYAANIEQDQESRSGMVTFELLREES